MTEQTEEARREDRRREREEVGEGERGRQGGAAREDGFEG